LLFYGHKTWYPRKNIKVGISLHAEKKFEPERQEVAVAVAVAVAVGGLTKLHIGDSQFFRNNVT
jgi:hypothetical protein